MASWNKWRKRVTHYIIVNVDDGVIQPTPGDHGRNLHYFPDQEFDLEANCNADSYEVCEFEGVPQSHLEFEGVPQNSSSFLRFFQELLE